MKPPIIDIIKTIHSNGHTIKADKRNNGYYVWIQGQPEMIIPLNGIPSPSQIDVLKPYLNSINK